ncbi:hypothetical protein Amet_0526 [Alkaliphilus metalliredigens QYMF]|uniref:Uncharacterized protein n=1 Tax=Alkaliphilus metalliredigens (strain QYMF) TaxID=293826 RepID=A6TKN5_ALKMQ|nr:hypothetical protein [Alkaliphilus metalliredigens]ABR46753.1 hypothetical protein Amet_0526 [Alkaliphilus metalliredigens QYMF]
MKRISIICMIILLFAFTVSPVYAHKMLIEPIEDGVIKVNYEDGSVSSRTEVVVYDSNGAEILTGSLDENGYFYYDTDLDATRIVADDGLGHRVEWQVGDPAVYSNHGSKWKKISLVVAIFVVIGSVFFLRNKKAKEKELLGTPRD